MLSPVQHRILICAAMAAGLVVATLLVPALPAQGTTGDWPTYLGDNGRSGFNPYEAAINPGTVSNLTLRGSLQAQGAVTVQPVVANGLVYWGAWDGYERATDLTGHTVWSDYLGVTPYMCEPYNIGVASSPTVATTQIGGASRSVLYIGDVNQLFALDAQTGSTIWQVSLGQSTVGWSSPLYYNGSIYIGVACGGKTGQNQLIQVDAASGNILHQFATSSPGCTGAGVWGSPTIDEAAGVVYFATGDSPSCGFNAQFSDSLIAVSASDLSLISSWQIPPAQGVSDGDIGSTPTLFSADIGGTTRSMLGIAGKNGIYYGFDRTNLAAGPLWSRRIAMAGDSPDYFAEGSISPSAWDGAGLYVAGGVTVIGGVTCSGSVQKLDPGTGNPVWQTCLTATNALDGSGGVLGAVTVVPGLVFVGAGDEISALSSDTGSMAWSYTDASKQPFYGAATIVNGTLFQGDYSGSIHAFTASTRPNIYAPPPPQCSNTVSISGHLFAPGESVQVYWDNSSSPAIASAIADGTGTFAGQFEVPQVPQGTHQLIAIGETSGTTASETYPISPRTCLASASGTQGSPNTLTGTGFAAGESISVKWGKTSLATTTADATGSFVGTSAVTFVTPSASYAPQSVTATGSKSGLSALSRFLMDPLLTITPRKGPPGTMITVSGADFSDSWPVTIEGNCGSSPCPGGSYLASATTTAAGSFAGTTATIPLSPGGPYMIGGQGTQDTFASAKFTVTQVVKISPTSGHRGAQATVGGGGYPANQNVVVTWNCSSAPCTNGTVLGSATTDSTGTFRGLVVTIPQSSVVGQIYDINAAAGTDQSWAAYTVTG